MCQAVSSVLQRTERCKSIGPVERKAGGGGNWGLLGCKPIGSVDFYQENMSAYCVHASIQSKCGAGRLVFVEDQIFPLGQSTVPG